MSEIKRYDWWVDFDDDDQEPYMKEQENGEYVLHSDHLAAMEAKDREIDGWKKLLMTAIAHIQINLEDKETAQELIEMSVAFEKESK